MFRLQEWFEWRWVNRQNFATQSEAIKAMHASDATKGWRVVDGWGLELARRIRRSRGR